MPFNHIPSSKAKARRAHPSVECYSNPARTVDPFQSCMSRFFVQVIFGEICFIYYLYKLQVRILLILIEMNLNLVNVGIGE